MRRAVPWWTIGVTVAMALACGEPQSLVNLDVTADQRYQPATLRIEVGGSIAKVFARVTLEPSTPLRIGIYLPSSVGGTVHVTGELDDAGCVLGRGSADVMNVKAGGSVGPVTLPIHASVGCDADGGATDAATGAGGAGNGGSGGSPGSGGAGAGGVSGAGGTGGNGAGGNGGEGTGAGGSGAATGGGNGSGGGAGTGGTGTGGRPGTGGAPGSGGRGSGGRPGTGGAPGSGGTSGTCVAAIRDSGYAAGGKSCAACQENATSLEGQCKAAIDCLIPLWPCTGTCLTNCLNQAGGPGTVATCVMALTDAACNGAGAGPCAGLCAAPIVFTTSTYSSSDLGTAATCHETTAVLTGVACGNFTPPRTFSANGKLLDCSSTGLPPLPAKRNGGYCFQASAGNPSYSYFATY